MKRLLILLGVMGIAVFFMLSETDRKEIEHEGKKIKKKLKKTHFHKNPLSVDQHME
jgi:hypothetical protein